MKIAIICSLDFSLDAGKIKQQLEHAGHFVTVPYTVGKILAGEIRMDDIRRMKEGGTLHTFTQAKDLIRWNYKNIQKHDAVLVINVEKKGIPNYIGANTFLEMGFAHVLHKKIFLWNEIPVNAFADEILAMQPIVIARDLTKLI